MWRERMEEGLTRTTKPTNPNHGNPTSVNTSLRLELPVHTKRRLTRFDKMSAFDPSICKRIQVGLSIDEQRRRFGVRERRENVICYACSDQENQSSISESVWSKVAHSFATVFRRKKVEGKK
jgi:hypothetical protein